MERRRDGEGGKIEEIPGWLSGRRSGTDGNGAEGKEGGRQRESQQDNRLLCNKQVQGKGSMSSEPRQARRLTMQPQMHLLYEGLPAWSESDSCRDHSP